MASRPGLAPTVASSKPSDIPVGACGLSRSQRLVRRGDFDEAYSSGRSYPGQFMVIHLREGVDANRRLGVVASKRTFRRSVDRNRARRLMREVYRMNRCRLSGTCDVVMVARGRILKAQTEPLRVEFETLARRAGIWAGSPS